MSAYNAMRRTLHVVKAEREDKSVNNYFGRLALPNTVCYLQIFAHPMHAILGSNRSWFQRVAHRNAPTLKYLIKKYIRPFTTVETDLWAAYHNLNILPQQYNHLVVNHNLNFVNPQDGSNTQTIESKNGQVKNMVRRKYGIRDEPFTSHLREFAWRERFGKRRESFFHFWHQISMFYPCVQ